MKNVPITIEFDEEKLAALNLYLTQKDTSVEEALVASLDNLFERHVPSSVRDFIALRSGQPVVEKEKRRRNKAAEESPEAEQFAPPNENG